MVCHGQPVAGELLVSLQLITKRDLGEKFSKPPSIAPPMRQAWIEIIAVGVRNVKPFGGAARGVGDAIREPFVKRGPLVMSTVADVERALAGYARGAFGRIPA